MALSSAISSTFSTSIPQQQGGRAIQQRGVDSQYSPLGSAPPTGLENVNEVTNAFYQKWGDLESFASRMKLQYGIDVTKPSFESDEAMEAHKIYQKGVADVRYQGNRLKQSQKMLEIGFKAKASTYGDRVNLGQVQGQAFDPSQFEVAPSGTQEAISERDRLNRESREKIARANLAYKRAKDKLTTETKIKDLAPYENLAKEVAKAFSGATEWTTNEDGSQTSSLFSGKRYGLGAKASKIRGLRREDNQIYLTFEHGEDLLLTPDVINDVYIGLGEGGLGSGSGIKMDDARRFLESITSDGGDIASLYKPKDSDKFIESANKGLLAQEEKNTIQSLKEAIYKDSSGEDILNQTFDNGGLVGLRYNGKIISKITQNTILKGKMTATLVDSNGKESDISFGGKRGTIDGDKFIDDVLKSSKQESQGDQPKQVKELKQGMTIILKDGSTRVLGAYNKEMYDAVLAKIESGEITVK